MQAQEHTESDQNNWRNAAVGGVSIQLASAIATIAIVAVAFLVLFGLQRTDATYNKLSDAADSFIVCETAANEMKEGSNYLTAQIRQFVITHDIKYLDNYFTEANETKRRDRAVEVLDSYAGAKEAHSYLELSRKHSNDLMHVELYAAKLILTAAHMQPHLGEQELSEIVLTEEDARLSVEEMNSKALSMVFGDDYQAYVDLIENDVSLCKNSLIADLKNEQVVSSKELDRLLDIQQLLTWVSLAMFVIVIIGISVLILRPIRAYIANMSKNKLVPLTGAKELRIMANEYNTLYAANLKYNDDLKKRAEHDHLTGLYNRAAFDRLLSAYQEDDIALLIVDADHFKDVNDEYGHDMGDKILQKLAQALSSTFRSSDYACRLGGDEFAVIMTDMTPDLKYVIDAKVARLTKAMRDNSDELPSMTLSIGIAFNDETKDSSALFKLADEALYRVKDAGRNGYQFYA